MEDTPIDSVEDAPLVISAKTIVLSAIDFVLAFAIWKRKHRFNKWLRPVAIGMLLVAVPFWGRSSEFHGAFASKR